MKLSVNGQSQVPPGFRFHPTEEELLHYYLHKKVAGEKIDLDVIRDVDLNKLEPWDIQEVCNIGSTPQNDWYFFSHKDKKYPTGTRTNRATAVGFWKATGRDKAIHGGNGRRRIGMRKTLVFYRGRAPHGKKSDWIMHEYRLDDESTPSNRGSNGGSWTQSPGYYGIDSLPSAAEEGWVVCRVFKKKNYHKAMTSTSSGLPLNSTKTTILPSSTDGILDQILSYIGSPAPVPGLSNVQEILAPNPTAENASDHLPALESPSSHEMTLPISPMGDIGASSPSTSDWATMDRLVASQLEGDIEQSKQLFSSFLSEEYSCEMGAGGLIRRSVSETEADFWNFTTPPSYSDPVCQFSVY